MEVLPPSTDFSFALKFLFIRTGEQVARLSGKYSHPMVHLVRLSFLTFLRDGS